MKRFFLLLAMLCTFAANAACITPSMLCVQAEPRPAGNTGAGFFVSGPKLFDPTGVENRIRGMNRTHWDSWGTDKGIPLTGANTVRLAPSFSRTSLQNLADLQVWLDAGITPMPSTWSTTCKSDPASLTAAVDTWIAQAPTWTTLNNTGLVNIANEWGPQSWDVTFGTHPNYTWRDAYVLQIPRMRAAGYLGALVVDAPGCGQDASAVVRDGPAILAADPQHNILFDVHVYGGFAYPKATVAWQQDYPKAIAAMKASGLPIIFGEFGPGLRYGPSPTSITPQQVIADAEANGWGWMPWAWDDNDLAGCKSSGSGFALTFNCGTFTGAAGDLTAFGQVVVPMFKSTGAKRATLR